MHVLGINFDTSTIEKIRSDMKTRDDNYIARVIRQDLESSTVNHNLFCLSTAETDYLTRLYIRDRQTQDLPSARKADERIISDIKDAYVLC